MSSHFVELFAALGKGVVVEPVAAHHAAMSLAASWSA